MGQLCPNFNIRYIQIYHNSALINIAVKIIKIKSKSIFCKVNPNSLYIFFYLLFGSENLGKLLYLLNNDGI